MPSKWIKIDRFTQGNQVKLVEGGALYFQHLLTYIQQAKKEIHLQVYILEQDETGLMVLKALAAAAQKGVAVYLVVDAFGSGKYREQFTQIIRESGIHFTVFGQFLKTNLSLLRRLHHKVFVVDGHTAVIGGINVSNNYNNLNDHKAWFDLAVEIKGPSVWEAKKICQAFLKNKWRSGKREIPRKKGAALVSLLQNDWLVGKNEISDLLLQSIHHAREEIIILGAYFMPAKKFRKALKAAAKRGVVIKVLISRISDVFLAHHASRYLYSWMLRNGMQVFEYQPSVLHGKAIMVDRDWSTIGSYNLNFLSNFQSVELNVEIVDKHFSECFYRYLTCVIQEQSQELTAQKYSKSQTLWQTLIDGLSYRILWLLFLIGFILSDKSRKAE